MPSSRFFLISLLTLFLVMSCAPRKTVSETKVKPDTTKMKKTQEEPSMPGEEITPTEDEDEYPALPEGYKRVLGFRVHVYRGTYREAKSVEKELKSSTDLKVHLVNDPPYYDVEVGDFLTREIAESVMNILLIKGYPESFVVETLVETH